MGREGLELCLISLLRPADKIAGYGPDGLYRMTDGSRIPFDKLWTYYGTATVEFFSTEELNTILSELNVTDRMVIRRMLRE